MERLTDERRALAGAPENIAFALSIAARVVRLWPRERDEIETAALEGLCAAAGTFDPARGIEFRTLAQYHVAGAIKDGLRRIGGGRRCKRPPMSLSGVVAADDAGIPFELLGAIPSGELPVGWEAESRDTVVVLSARLPLLHGAVLREYYLRPGRTLARIAADLDLSQSRISQILTESLATLKGCAAAAARPAPAAAVGAEFDADFRARFFARVVRAGDCWLFRGAARDGSPAIWRGKRRLLAHRVSYEMHVGSLPGRRELSQTCGDRRCVNPAHLSLTRKEAVA